MKREDTAGVERVGRDELSSLFSFANGDESQLEALRAENAGLRRLVAELLLANQQLRERYSAMQTEELGTNGAISSRVDDGPRGMGHSGDLADGR